jgi:hypothetical protein
MANQQSGNQKRQREAAEIWEARRADIVRLYADGTWSQAQIADHYAVSQQAMAKVLARMGIAAKSRSRAGQQNGRFKDGSESTAYRKMIAKDACVRCGVTENLCIHHKDEDHTNNVPSNLEVMCMSCHSAMHKTEWWRSRKDGQS